MKYFETLIDDQETTISVLYKEQIIKVYSSEPKTIQKLTKTLGTPSVKYKKSKTYWSGASWSVSFFELDKIKEIINRDAFIDKRVKPILNESKDKKIMKNKNAMEEKTKAKVKVKTVNKTKTAVSFEQIQLGI